MSLERHYEPWVIRVADRGQMLDLTIEGFVRRRCKARA